MLVANSNNSQNNKNFEIPTPNEENFVIKRFYFDVSAFTLFVL